jgi:tetratricopeptide (TPR) repeat protein
MIGECYFILDEYDQAIKELSEIVNYGAKQPKVLYLLGFAHRFVGNEIKSRKYLRQFIQIAGPEHSHLVFNAKEVLEP